MTESGKTQFPKRGLEEENQLLRLEVERLKQILATHGLSAASALINFAPQLRQCSFNSRKTARNEASSGLLYSEACFVDAMTFMQNAGPVRTVAQDIRLRL